MEKSRLAADNNVEQIVVDCSKTDYSFIKQNILCSRLSEILDLSNIDWKKIVERCSKNYIKVASDLYSSGMTISDIARTMMFERHTIARFLLDGKELGWCDYEPISCRELYKKDIKITNVKTNQEIVIHGVNEATRFIEKDSEIRVDRHTIKDYCNGYRTLYYGGKHTQSLEGVLYKDTYKFERV